jgi:hypothetical protein
MLTEMTSSRICRLDGAGFLERRKDLEAGPIKIGCSGKFMCTEFLPWRFYLNSLATSAA